MLPGGGAFRLQLEEVSKARPHEMSAHDFAWKLPHSSSNSYHSERSVWQRVSENGFMTSTKGGGRVGLRSFYLEGILLHCARTEFKSMTRDAVGSLAAGDNHSRPCPELGSSTARANAAHRDLSGISYMWQTQGWQLFTWSRNSPHFVQPEVHHRTDNSSPLGHCSQPDESSSNRHTLFNFHLF
jgi:hypothetical protein